MPGNEVFIARSMAVARAARLRMAQLHPDLSEEKLDEAAHEAEIAYLVAVRDVFNSIADLAVCSPAGPN